MPDDSRNFETDDAAELPAVADGDGGENLMTRREVAYKFGVHSATVKNWARSSAVTLTEVKDGQDRPRYRRSEVEALFESGFRGFESRSAASRLRRR